MRIGILLFAVIILISSFTANALNNDKKSLEVTKVSESPKVDGILNETAWKNASVANDFLQYEPYNGKEPLLPTEVKIIYDDQAIYFGATMYDSNPDSIIKDLGVRDSFTGLNSDLFTVLISTFNDVLMLLSSWFLLLACNQTENIMEKIATLIGMEFGKVQ